MGTYRYSIVRFVPDPSRGEQLNVGVVVAGESPPYFSSMFVTPRKAGRLRHLASGVSDLSFLQDLADEMGSEQQSRLFSGSWNLEALERAVAEWANTVQFAPLRAAVHDEPDALLRRLFERYVAHPEGTKSRARGRQWLRRRVKQTLTKSLTDLSPELEIESVIAQRVRVHGAFDEHTVDFVLKNGAPRSYVQTLSVETDDRIVKSDVDVLKWTIDDLRHSPAQRTVPVTVVAVGEGELLDKAQTVYERLDATVVREHELDPWAERAAHELLAGRH